jgi:hypothetical protein
VLSLKIAFIAEDVADALLVDKVVCRLNLHLFYLLVNPVTCISILSCFWNKFCNLNLSVPEIVYRRYLLAVPRDKITQNQIWQVYNTVYAYYCQCERNLYKHQSVFCGRSCCIVVLKICVNRLLA